MKLEKYIVIVSYVSHETKTSVTVSPVFLTAIEALLWHKNAVENASVHASEKSYSFYEICNWTGIDSTKLFTKSKFDMEALARMEIETIFPNPTIA